VTAPAVNYVLLALIKVFAVGRGRGNAAPRRGNG
jgi:hypothetical protein